MTAVELIAAALPSEPLPEAPEEGVCCVTGKTGLTIGRGHVIKPSFTNLDLLKAPSSDRAGIAAWTALNYKWERMSSWACDGNTFERLDRQGVRHLVLDERPRPAECAYYATTSYKKHGSLLAPANPPGKKVWLFELRLVDCSNAGEVKDMWDKLRAAQTAGIPRPLIESLDISPGHMAKIGWKVWREFEEWAGPRKLAPLYQFLTYLLPSMEELKNGCH